MINRKRLLFVASLLLLSLAFAAFRSSQAKEISPELAHGEKLYQVGEFALYLPIVIGGGDPESATATPTNTATATVTATNTSIPAATATNTPISAATNTPQAPAATATNTPQPAAATATNTPQPAAATATNTSIPVATATNTPQPSATATNTPTATATAINTPTSGGLNLPATLYNYADISLPQHFNGNQIQQLDNTPNNNPITDEGATLGRVLFYDTNLSANDTTSCASCHLQEKAFVDGVQFSTGFEGGLTGRNSMGLANARFYENGSFFWDERANSLEEQTLMPIQDPIEMGLTLDELVTKLQALDYYPSLFEDTFGDSQITTDRVSRALAQFVRSMVSYQSKYDEGRQESGNPDNDFSNFTDEENRGKEIFFNNNEGGCERCHGTEVFVGDQPRNNGLDLVSTDNGEGGVNGNQNDNGKFKFPSLRNIELTAPYMHDGRFETLEEVVEHYNSGVQAHPNLDNRLRQRNNGPPRRLNLSEAEKAALVAFLKTLTDNEFITDPKFSDPFTP